MSPRPYQNPRIDLDRTGGRAWQWVTPLQLELDDIVQDRGAVDGVVGRVEGTALSVLFRSGEHRDYEPDELIFAYTARG